MDAKPPKFVVVAGALLALLLPLALFIEVNGPVWSVLVIGGAIAIFGLIIMALLQGSRQ